MMQNQVPHRGREEKRLIGIGKRDREEKRREERRENKEEKPERRKKKEERRKKKERKFRSVNPIQLLLFVNNFYIQKTFCPFPL